MMSVRYLFILATICLMIVFIPACSNNNTSQQNHAEPEDKTTENNTASNNENKQEELELTELLPDKKGYTWKYDGAVEYGHEMELKSIEESDKQATYTVEGDVEDASGGESKKNDFSLDVTYTVTKDQLIQEVDSETMMGNNFSQIELIRPPLSEGNKWTQTQENAEGEEITLESTIDSIENDGEQKIYTVSYEDNDSDYYEKREIKEGVGIIAFENLYINENNANNEDDMPMGYELNYHATGYSDDQKTSNKNNGSNTEDESSTKNQKEADEITENQAIDNVLDYVKEHEDYDDVNAMVDGGEEGKFNVRVFEDHSDHIATLGWYTVDKETGEVDSKDL